MNEGNESIFLGVEMTFPTLEDAQNFHRIAEQVMRGVRDPAMGDVLLQLIYKATSACFSYGRVEPAASPKGDV